MSDILKQNRCSPRKIRKVEPVSQKTYNVGQIQESQESQQSCATSTPTKQNLLKNFDISLDLSSIHSVFAAPSERSFLNESIQNEEESGDDVSTIHSKLELSLSNETSSICSGSSVGKHLSLLLKKPNAKIFKGKLWKFFKPKNEETLYFKIFTDFDGIQECATDLLNEFQMNKWNAILSLMKFFIDVSGYQSFELEKYFNEDIDPNSFSEKVIKLMEFDLVDPKLLEYKTYIFYESERGKSKLSATLTAAVQKFLQIFFLGVHAINQLFSDVLYKYLLNFLYHMCQSILRPIRHTGLVLVRMLLTILNHIMEQLMIKGDTESIDEELPSGKKIQYMERYLEFFFKLFAKNCLIPDSNLAILRAENVLEMGTWISDSPQLYFKKCFELLPKLLIDEYEVVRLNTLNAFDSFLKTENTHLYVKRYIKIIVKMVSDRLKDVSIKVVVAAVKIFSDLLDDYREFIGAENICEISNLLYGVSYLYGKAAGSFMSKYLASTYTDESQLLHNFVELSNTPRFVKMKPLFIEAFSEHETVLKNYGNLVNYLITSSENEPLEFYNNLMELIYYSVYQTLKGESILKRKHSVQASPLSSDHQQIAEIFLLNIKSLFELFGTKPIALKYLIKILCLIEYDFLSISYHSQFIFVLKNCRQFFLKIDDSELLESICHLFSYICYDKNISLKESMKGKLLDNLFHSMSDYLKGYLESEDQEISLENHFKKIAVMYEKLNLNEYFEWNDLFLNWGKVLLCTGQITSCKQFLIWRTEEMTAEKNTSSDEFRTKLIYFKKIFSDYTKSLVSVLVSADATNDLKYEAFTSLCHLHNHCDRIFLNVPEFNSVRFGIIEDLKNYFCGSLAEFFKKSIVYDTSLSLETRKKYIISWLNLIFNGLIDILYIVPLFECYHVRSQEYGSLIEWISDKVYANNPETFFNIILATLGDLAVELFGTQQKSVLSPEAKELMELAAKYSNMAQFKHSSDEVLKFIRLALTFTFKEELLEFLILLKNFTSKLSTDEQQGLDILQEIMPPEYENHNFVKAFRKKLNSKNIKAGKGNLSFIMSSNSRSKEEIEKDFEPKLKKRKRSFTPKKHSKTIKKKSNKKGSPGKVSRRKKQLSTYESDEDIGNSFPKSEKEKKGKKNETKSTASKAKNQK